MKRLMLIANILIVAAMLLSACATPTPEVIKEIVTQVVTQVVKETVVQKEVVKETVIVAGTPEVVEKEVTKIVEVEKEVTKIVEVEVPKEAEGGEIVQSGPLKVAFRENWAEGFNGFTGSLWTAQGDISPYLYMPLVYDDYGEEVYPWLAESWEIAADGSAVTFHLHPDAVWSDGVPVTAADVKYTYEMYCHRDVMARDFGFKGNEEALAGETTDVPGIVAVDDHTVRFEFREGKEQFWIDYGRFNMFVVPKHMFEDIPVEELIKGTYDEAMNPTVISGPYKLGKVERNLYFEAIRRDDWWGEKHYGQAGIEKILAMTEIAGGAQPAIIRGDLHLAQGAVAAADVEEFEERYQHLEVIVGTQSGWGYALNCRPERKLPLKIRQALHHASDRDAIIEVFSLGRAKKLYCFMDNEGPYSDPTLVWREYDPEMAKQLIAEAVEDGDWDPDRVIEIVLNEWGDASERGAAFLLWVQQIVAVGLKAELQVAPGGLYDERLWDGDFDITISWGGPRGAPERSCPYFLLPSGYWWDRLGWYDEEFVDYCTTAMTTVDEEIRKEYFGKATRLFYEKGPWQWWSDMVLFFAKNKGLCGVQGLGTLIGINGDEYGLFSWHWCEEGE